MGSYDVRLKFAADGKILSSQCKKPSFWSKVGGVSQDVVLPVALTVMSFIPVTAPFAIAANAADRSGDGDQEQEPAGDPGGGGQLRGGRGGGGGG